MRKGQQLPLFPLNVVLFPQMQQRLYIFEERYKRMISRCIEFDEPFGIVLIRSGSEIGETAEPYLVGTTARIKEVDHLGNGELDILVEGEERFRVRKLDNISKPYLLGTIEPLEEMPLPNSTSAKKLLKQAQKSFRIYLELMFAMHNVKIKVHFPKDASVLSFAMAMALDVEPLQKQHFLELTDTVERFEELIPEIEDRIVQMRRIRTVQIDRERYAEEWLSRN